MKIYFYHTQDLNRIYREWQKGDFQAHFLYGATHLNQYGIDMIMHQHYPTPNHFKTTLYTTIRILLCREPYEILYATSFRGLELIIFLRALRIYRHPIVLWHHQPIKKADNHIRELIARFFYRGIDKMIFFSQKLIEDSLNSPKARKERMCVVPWGADLEFYDKIMAKNNLIHRQGFISTGKEMRDMYTLVNAFNKTNCPLDIYISSKAGNIDYSHIFNELSCADNIKVHFITGLIPNKLGSIVNKSSCIVICCLKTNYTAGLTTVVEALALGIPLICSRNPQMPIDIDKVGCGITVEYGDVDGWISAITYISTHPEEALEMGRKGRHLAEETFNINNCAKQISKILKDTLQ